LTSGKSQILFFDIDQQCWAIVDSEKTLLKNVPEGISFDALPENIKLTDITIAGYKYQAGIAGIIFSPDGGCEYAEINLSDIQSGEEWKCVLNPYVSGLQITRIAP